MKPGPLRLWIKNSLAQSILEPDGVGTLTGGSSRLHSTLCPTSLEGYIYIWRPDTEQSPPSLLSRLFLFLFTLWGCGAVGRRVLSVADQPILLPVPFCASENIISSLLFPSDCCRLSSAPQTIYDSISKCDIRVWYWYCASAAMGPMAMTIWECYVCFSRVYIMLCVCVRCLFMCQKCHY